MFDFRTENSENEPFWWTPLPPKKKKHVLEKVPSLGEFLCEQQLLECPIEEMVFQDTIEDFWTIIGRTDIFKYKCILYK